MTFCNKSFCIILEDNILHFSCNSFLLFSVGFSIIIFLSSEIVKLCFLYNGILYILFSMMPNGDTTFKNELSFGDLIQTFIKYAVV